MACLISFERCQSSSEEHGTSEHYKNNLVHGRIRTTNTASRLQVHRSHHSATTRFIWDWIKCLWNLLSIDKLEKVHVYIASTICRFQPYNVWILLKTVTKYLHWSIRKTIQMWYHGNRPGWGCKVQVHEYHINNVTVVGHFYNIWILLKTIIKYLHWSIYKSLQMLHQGTAATAIHIYTMFVFIYLLYIYRLYRSIYKLHGHLIPSHTKRVVAEWWEQWTWNLEAVRCWWFESYRGQDFFVMFTCSVFLTAGLAAFKWNQAGHSSEVIGA